MVTVLRVEGTDDRGESGKAPAVAFGGKLSPLPPPAVSRPQGNFFCRVLPRTLCTGETQECQTAVFASVVAFVNSIDKKKSPVCTFQLLTKLGLLLHFWTPHSFCLQRLVQP